MVIGLIVGILFCAGVLFFGIGTRTAFLPKRRAAQGLAVLAAHGYLLTGRGCWGSAGMWSYPPGTGC